MNRLWVQLTLVCVLVAVIGIASIAVLANVAIARNFQDFIARNQVDLDDGGLPTLLVAYYERNGGWAGVGAVMNRIAPWQGRGEGGGPPGSGSPRLEVVIADAAGTVVYANRPRRSEMLSAVERENAVPLTSQGQPAGYVSIVAGPIEALNPLERAFVDQVRRSLTLAALLAIGVGVVLGITLSRNLARPLNRLAAAARAIAGKDLSQRVEPSGAAEIKEVGYAFNEMAASLEQSEELRRNLVADVAHELRTPLTVLQGNLTALLDGVYPLKMDEVARLYDETRLLHRLVDDLRELAQAEAGQLELDIQPTDLAAVIRAAADAFGPAAVDRHITLESQVPPDLPRARADAGRIAQVLRNLLANALRYTPAGGVIRVSAQAVPGGVEVSVSDTGEGIPAESVPYVFERFWRGDASRARETGGTGLGLAIARQLIKEQGGQIGVDSQVGRGSRFWFRLPTV